MEKKRVERENKNKKNALEEFAYIEFLTSRKRSNPFRQYPDIKKEGIIRKSIITQKAWNPDKLVVKAIEYLYNLQKNASTIFLYYESAKKAIDHLSDFVSHMNLSEKNPKTGAPIYKPIDLSKAIADTDKVASNFTKLEEKMDKQLSDNVKNRSNKEVSPFADPASMKEINDGNIK